MSIQMHNSKVRPYLHTGTSRCKCQLAILDHDSPHPVVEPAHAAPCNSRLCLSARPHGAVNSPEAPFCIATLGCVVSAGVDAPCTHWSMHMLQLLQLRT